MRGTCCGLPALARDEAGLADAGNALANGDGRVRFVNRIVFSAIASAGLDRACWAWKPRLPADRSRQRREATDCCFQLCAQSRQAAEGAPSQGGDLLRTNLCGEDPATLELARAPRPPNHKRRMPGLAANGLQGQVSAGSRGDNRGRLIELAEEFPFDTGVMNLVNPQKRAAFL
jgi:hypothetical protein